MQPLFKGLSINIRGANNSPDEIRKLCPDLDFTPQKVQGAFISPLGTYYSTGRYRIMNPATYGLIDAGSEVSRDYKVHDVKEILGSLCEISSLAGLTLANAVVLRGGEHIILRAESSKTFAPVVGDTYGGSVLFKISNVPGIVSSCSAYVLRLVCTNGATAKEDLGSGVMKLHHRRNYDSEAREEVEKLSQSLEVALQSYEQKLQRLYQEECLTTGLYFAAVLETPLEECIETRVFKQLMECILLQPGYTETLSQNRYITYATLYNAVTYWVDHIRGRKPESALFSTIYGDGARLKRKALQLALEMIKENS